MIPASRSRIGFTLIELLVVISIISLLSTLALLRMENVRASARDAVRQHDIAVIQTMLALYYNDNGYYPSDPGASCGDWLWSKTYDSQWIPGLVPEYGTAVPRDPRANCDGDGGDPPCLTYSCGYGYLTESTPTPQWYLLGYNLEVGQDINYCDNMPVYFPSQTCS